ncbi:DUF1015 domain-containing protein, partial [candidate division KSB1 bacterium]|nr:DUF1015 domain-containing protein [candidate division KSB1 bacterium]
WQDREESIYIYRLSWHGHSQIGYFCLASVDDYDSGRIRKHELTRADKEADRTKLTDIQNAQIGPVLLMYASDRELDGYLEQATQSSPLVDFVATDEVRHEIWRIHDPQTITQIREGFKKLDYLYVADGHHRSAAASNLCKTRRKLNPDYSGEEPFNFFLAAIFPHNQLKILPYNRAVKDLNELSTETLLSRIRKKFAVDKVGKKWPDLTEHSMGMYLQSDWYLLKANPETYNDGDPLESLDVNILMHNILEPILGIKDPRTDRRIDFIGGIRGNQELVKLVDSGKCKVAFAMYPTSVERLMAVADANMIMPPKSTWFEPKLRSGLLIHLLS